MKLNKKKLLAFVRGAMSELGYVEFDDNLISNANLFVKSIGDLYLTIGFTIHRFYDDKFTCSYYLSRTTNWAECWGDIPHRLTYVRPGELMTPQERYIMTVDGNCKKNPNISDIWWNAFDKEGEFDDISLESFMNIIRLTEHRVIQQKDIVDKIYASKLLQSIYDNVNRTILHVQSESYRSDFLFLPKKETKGVTMSWYMAAETTLRECDTSDYATSHRVKFLAADASRVYHMRQLAKK